MTDPDDSLRVSDAERDDTLRVLGDHAAVGRLTLNLVAVMGGANVYIPDSVELDVGGFSVMGGNTEIGSERPPRPGAPVIRLRTWNLMGGATIFRVPPQARGLDLREARRLAKAAGRGELPAPG